MSDEEETPSRVAIGISFGNSYSSIAVTSSEGKVEVIANEEGDRQIPSVLAYVDGEEFQGTQAKAQLIRNAKNTVICFRDFLGQDFKSIDPSPCHQAAHPLEHNGTIAFKIRDSEAESENTVTVSEITTRHLRRLKTSASDFLGQQVNAAVITIPTNFSDKQRQSLKQAATDAGLEVLQLIHEPVAALLAYDARHEAEVKDKTVIVVDVGGTRSDVTIVTCRGGIYTILAAAHDYDVSGAQLDQTLIDYFAKEFLKKNKGTEDPRENARSLSKLKLECEAVKKALSLGQSASFSVESLVAGIDYTATINRSRYDLLSIKLFQSLKRLVLSTLEKADLDVLDIDEIVCAGGNSHTPKLASTLQEGFPESVKVFAPSATTSAINPSELSARGAAIQASLVGAFDADDVEQSIQPVVTATPHLTKALGILSISGDESTGRFTVLVHPNTPVPVRKTAVVAVPREGGDVLVKLCEGVREIKVTKPEPKPKTNGQSKAEDDDEDDEDDSDEEEDEEQRELVWKAGGVLAELAVKGTKKGGKVEVQVSIGADLEVQIIAREVGGSGVRGTLKSPGGA